jgi:hypothetical protein
MVLVKNTGDGVMVGFRSSATATGGPLSESFVVRWFGRLKSTAGVTHGRLYDCRERLPKRWRRLSTGRP